MISPSSPEPLYDVAAQLAALADPTHPKTAVWLALGTGLPPDRGEFLRVETPAGLLLTADWGKALTFARYPSDDTLAGILGYSEPKSAICGMPIVVQARDARGAVVLEMASSERRFGEAIAAAGRHGAVEIMTLPQALLRRAQLVSSELLA